MVDNTDFILLELMKLGLSAYEVKAYLSLLDENPATAYETGKASGIPTSKVYEVLKKLVGKGVVSVIDAGRTKRYIPLAADEFLNRHKNIMDKTIDSLRTELSVVKGKQGFSYIWNITDYGYSYIRSKRQLKVQRKLSFFPSGKRSWR